MEISLKTLISVLKKAVIWMIIFAILAGVGTYFAVSYFVEPTYVSVAEVNLSGQDLSSGETSSSVTQQNNKWVYANRIVKTCSEILATNNFRSKIREELKLGYNPNYSVSFDEETTILTISARDKDPTMAYRIAKTAIELADDYLDEKLSEPINAIIIEDPRVPANPSSPNKTMFAAVAAVVIAVVIFGVQLLRELLGIKVKNEVELFERYNIPVIAVIPDFDQAARHYKKYEYSSYGAKGGE